MTPSSASRSSSARSDKRSSHRGASPARRTVPAHGRQGTARAATGAENSPEPSRAVHQIPIRFTGRGGEYFWIWIVDLALTLVTFSLYLPWARGHALQYFCDHTRLHKQALDYHSNPWKMLRTQLLVILLVLGYGFSHGVSPRASVLGGISLAILWPAVYRASLQARLAHTGWRGVRFGFVGSLQGAYLLFAVPLLVGGALVAARTVMPGSWRMAMVSACAAALSALVPWFCWLLKKYQHDHLTCAQHQAELRVGVGSFYGVFLSTLLMGVLVVSLAGAAVVALVVMIKGSLQPLSSSQAALDAWLQMGWGLAPLIGLGVGGILLLQAVMRAHFISRMQNLLWSRTGGRGFRFKSELSAGPLTGLLFKHTVLMGLTLGLYYPFARVALARQKLGALTLVARATLLEDLTRSGAGRAN